MPRLIWVFAGRILTLLVLSCRGIFFWPHTNYRNDPKYSDRQIWESIVDPDQTVPGAVWSESTLFAILSFKVQYSVVKPNCSDFRILTAIFSGVRIFPILMVIGSVDWPVLVRLVKFGIFDAHHYVLLSSRWHWCLFIPEFIWATTWQNQQSEAKTQITQRRLRSAWATAQSDQSLRCVLSG